MILTERRSRKRSSDQRGGAAFLFSFAIAIFLTLVLASFNMMSYVEDRRIAADRKSRLTTDSTTYLVELMNQLMAAKHVYSIDWEASPEWPNPSIKFFWEFSVKTSAKNMTYTFEDGFPRERRPRPNAPVAALNNKICNVTNINAKILYDKVYSNSKPEPLFPNASSPALCPTVGSMPGMLKGRIEILEAKKDGFLRVQTIIASSLRLPTIVGNSRLADLVPFNLAGTEETVESSSIHSFYGKPSLPTKYEPDRDE